jgi:hypothetical protein
MIQKKRYSFATKLHLISDISNIVAKISENKILRNLFSANDKANINPEKISILQAGGFHGLWPYLFKNDSSLVWQK